MIENLPLCGSQNAMAKSFKAEIVAQVAKIVRRAGLDYDGWRYVAKKSARSATCVRARSRRGCQGADRR